MFLYFVDYVWYYCWIFMWQFSVIHVPGNIALCNLNNIICNTSIIFRQNNIQKHGTATASTDAHGGPCMDDRGSTWTDKHTHGSTSKDARRSTFTNVYTESTDVHGIKWPYISTKDTGMHEVTSTDDSTVNTVVHGRTNVYDEYWRYKPKQHIVTDIVVKVQKGIRYSDELHLGS